MNSWAWSCTALTNLALYKQLQYFSSTFQREKQQKRWEGRIPSQTLHKPFNGILPLKIPYQVLKILPYNRGFHKGTGVPFGRFKGFGGIESPNAFATFGAQKQEEFWLKPLQNNLSYDIFILPNKLNN